MARRNLTLIFLLLLSLALPFFAQGQPARPIDFTCRNCKVSDALVSLSRQSGINIVFNDRLFQRCEVVNIEARQKPMADLIADLTACAGVELRWLDGQFVLARKETRFTLSGFVQDAETGERLIGAGISTLNGKPVFTSSNEFGFFSLTLDAGAYQIRVTSLGYQAADFEVDMDRDLRIKFALRARSNLPEVVVSAESEKNTPTNAYRVDAHNRLPLVNLQTLPMPGGEADLLRLAAMQPGVHTGADGLGGLHIRGGNADQNLILLDDVPVYNPSHALGLFSIFNPATVSSARLWKGDFPARYGGRTASVLDVRTREGNFREFKADASIGLFAASVTAEGPVKKDQSSFLLGLRTTYFRPWVEFLSNRENLLSFSGDRVVYRYYDANLKWNYTFSNKHRLYFSFYQGGDNFRDQFNQRFVSTDGLVTDRYTLGSFWGNTIAALRWNHVLGHQLFTNTTIRFSRFFYQSQLAFRSDLLFPNGKQELLNNYGQLYQTLIRDWSGKTDFTFFPSEKLTVRWGGAYTLHAFQPGALSVNFLLPVQSAESIDSLAAVLLNNEKLSAQETELYLEFEWRPWRRISVDMGVNASVFQIRQVNYPNLLPRFKFIHAGPRGFSQWFSYTGTAQNLHQIGSFNISLPFELWVPSTAKVPPERVRQFAVGLSAEIKGWYFQAEAYYKEFDRVLAFLSSNDALFTGGAEDASGWEDRIASGVGWSRGLELVLEKKWRWTHLSAAYTLSRSLRRFPDLNSGREFPFRYDRPHDLKINLRQQAGSRLEIDLAWYFATGNPITLSGVQYTHHSPNSNIFRDVYVYSEVNGYRLPNYHRLDVTLNVDLGGKKVEQFLQVGAYNVYNRNNPFFLFVDAGSGVPGKAVQYTLLPILPILRYELKW